MVFRAVGGGFLPSESELCLLSACYRYGQPRLVLPLNRVKADGKSKVKALFQSPCLYTYEPCGPTVLEHTANYMVAGRGVAAFRYHRNAKL